MENKKLKSNRSTESLDDFRRKISERKCFDDQLIQSLPHLAMIINKERKVVAANAAARGVGFEAGHELTRVFSQVKTQKGVCPKHQIETNSGDCYLCLADKAIKSGQNVQGTAVKALNRLWDVHWSRLDENAFFNYSIDVTAQKSKEESLRESETKYRLLVETMNEGLSVTDKNYRFTFVNRRFTEILGYSEHELLGRQITDFFDENNKKIMLKQLALRKKGQEKSYDITWKAKDGRDVNSIISPRTFLDEDGNFLGSLGIFVDITERKQIEKARDQHLHDMNKRIRELRCMYRVTKAIRHPTSLETLFEEILMFMPSGWQWPEITRAKLVFCGKEYISKPFKETEWKMSSDIVVEEQVCGRLEVYYLEPREENDEGPFLVEERNLLDSVASSISDAIEARRADEKLENIAKFPSENPYPVVRVLQNGVVHYSNPAGKELLKSLGCEVGEKIPDNWHEYLLRVFKSGSTKETEVTCEGKIFSLTLTPIVDSGYVNIYGMDITERRCAEEDLQKYRQHLEELVADRTVELTRTNQDLLVQIEKGKRLEKEILDISEHEQRRIGRELHDSIGQQFTGISFMTKVLEQKLAEKMPDEAAYLVQIRELVNDAISQTRILAKGLHPVDLSSTSLVSVMQDMAENIEKIYNINCTFECEGDTYIEDSEVAVHLYRITREAVNNAIKHARANNIMIKLDSRPKKSVLTVRNDGKVFPPDIEKVSTGMGLHIMKHRADLISGSLDIHRDEQGWTVLRCVFPNK